MKLSIKFHIIKIFILSSNGTLVKPKSKKSAKWKIIYIKPPKNSYYIKLIRGVLDASWHSSPSSDGLISDYKFPVPPFEEIHIFKYNKFAVLASDNTVTQLGNTAKARPFHLVTGKADVGVSFKCWVLRRTLQKTKSSVSCFIIFSLLSFSSASYLCSVSTFTVSLPQSFPSLYSLSYSATVCSLTLFSVVSFHLPLAFCSGR